MMDGFSLNDGGNRWVIVGGCYWVVIGELSPSLVGEEGLTWVMAVELSPF